MATAYTTETMHQDHLRWQEEQATWRDDLEAWELELDEAVGDLSRLHQALLAQHKAMVQHGRVVRKQIQNVMAHEHRLAVKERCAKTLEPLTDAHERETKSQMELARSHEAMKQRHRAMMARMAKVAKWLLEDPLD